MIGAIIVIILSMLFIFLYCELCLHEEIVVAGAIRGVKGRWFTLDDSSHKSLNIKEIGLTKGGSIVVYFTFAAEKIHTFHVTTDERFANRGYFVGAAVSGKFAKITIFQNENGTIKKIHAHKIDCPLCNLWVYGLFS